MRKLNSRTMFALAIAGLFGVGALAGIPSQVQAVGAAGIYQTINYQGRLLTATGAVVPDGTYNMEFQIWQDGNGCVTGCTSANAAANNGGTLKWTEDWIYGTGSPDNRVTIKNGYFSVSLGAITSLSPVNFNWDTNYLTTNIGNTSTSASFAAASPDGYMIPFKRLSANPYAINSSQLGGLTSSQYVQLGQGVQNATSSGVLIGANQQGAGTILDLQKGGADVLLVDSTGSTLFRPNSDSATALQVQKAGTTTKVFTVDTTNSRIGIGNISPAYAVDAVGSINASTSLKIATIDVCTSSGCVADPTYAIRNQNGSQQTSSNFWISGVGRADTGFTVAAGATSAYDVASAGTLNIGVTNANAIIIGKASATTTFPGAVLISGTSTSNYKLNIGNILSSSNTSSQYGVQNQPTVIPTGASLSNFYSLLNLPNIGTGAVDITNVFGAYSRVDTTGGGTPYTGQITNGAAFIAAAPSISGTKPINNYYQVQVSGNTSNVGLIGNTAINYGVGITAPAANSIYTTNYGLYLTGNGGASATNWALYNNSTSDSYFAGNILVGTTSNASSYALNLVGTAAASVKFLSPSFDTASSAVLNIGTAATATSISLGNSTTALNINSAAVNFNSNYGFFGGTSPATVVQKLALGGTISSTNTGSQYGLDNEVSFSPQGASTISAIYGSVNIPNLNGGSANVSALIGFTAGVTETSGYTGTVADARGLNVASPTVGGNKFAAYTSINISSISANGGNTTGTLTNTGLNIGTSTSSAGVGGTVNNYALSINQPSGSGGTATNNYGLFIQGAGAGTANWSIYNSSTADSYYAGNILVGTTSNPSSYALNVIGTAAASVKLLSPALDVASAGTLSIGTTNASTITIGKSAANTATTANGTLLVKPTSGNDSTTAFQVQAAGGNEVLTVSTTGTGVTLGKASAVTGQLTFANATNGFTSIITGNTAATASYTSVLPGAVGSAGQCLSVASVVTTTQTLGYATCATGTFVTLQGATPSSTDAGGFKVSGQAVIGSSTNQIQLAVKANASQSISTPLIQLQSSTGTAWADLTADGNSNIAFGFGAGSGLSGGISNIALGTAALDGALTNDDNIGIGRNAVGTLTSGSGNVGIGLSALATSNGSSNVAVGAAALQSATSGNNNTAIGTSSGFAFTSGSFNTALGTAAGSGDTDGFFLTTGNISGSTAIGYGAQVQQSSSIVLGSVTQGTKVGIGTTEPNSLFSVSPVSVLNATASQTGGSGTITATTSVFSLANVGQTLIWADGTAETIIGYTSATVVTGSSTAITKSGIRFRTHIGGFQVASDGTVAIQATSATAFQLQSTNGVTAIAVDTTATNNYIVNSGFDTGVSGWAATGGAGTPTQTTAVANTNFGIAAMTYTTTGANQGVITSSFTQTVPAAIYRVSAYIKTSSIQLTSNTLFTINDGSNRTCNPTLVGSVNSFFSTGYARAYCNITTTANAVSFSILQLDATARTAYIDGVQIETSGGVSLPSAYRVAGINLRGVITAPLVVQTTTGATNSFQVLAGDGTSIIRADTSNAFFYIGNDQYTGGSVQFVGAGSVNASGSNSLTLGTGSSGSILLGNTGTTTINIGGTVGSTTTIAGGDVAHTVAIAAAGATTTQAVTLGSTGSVSSTLIQGGVNGANATVSLQTAASGVIAVGTTLQSGTVTIGATALNTGTQTINLGASNTSGGTTNVSIGSGSSATGGTTTVTAKGALTLTGNAASTWSTGAGLLTITGAGGTTITGNTGVLTVGNTGLTGLGLNLVGPTYTNATRGITVGTADANITLFDLDQSSSITAETGANCTTSINAGGLYYNSNAGSGAIRACMNGAWEDLVSTAGLGIILFGVVPDSGTNPGDLVSIAATGGGPCKVVVGGTNGTGSSNISWSACTAYSGGRKVTVAAATNQATSANAVAGNVEHLCLTGTNSQPALQATSAETGGLPTFSAGAPILCIADIKFAAANQAITAIYDTRTFTTATKHFANVVTTAPGNGWLVTTTATSGQYTPTTTTGQTGKIAGVVVATAGGTTANTINAIIAIDGPAYIKATATGGSNAVNDYVMNSATAGYAYTIAAPTTPPLFSVAGISQSVLSTTCAVSADSCRGSVFTIMNIR